MPSFQHQQMFERVGISLTSLKKLKSLKSERYYTFDCETKDGLIAKDLFCYAFCEKSNNSFNNSFVKTDDLTYLFQRLTELHNKKRYTIVYIHNQDFDIRFIIKYCLDHKIDYHAISSGSSIISLIIQSIRVKFIDTMQFLQCKQEKAEKIYNVPSKYTKINCEDIFNKPYIKWTNSDKKRLKAHNLNDVIALHIIIERLRQELFKICSVDFLTILTPASLSIKAYRKFMHEPINNPFVYQKWNNEKHHISYHYDKENYDFVKQSYHGGRTEVFNTDYHENVIYFDKVSMYPYVMKEKIYPKGWGIKYHNTQSDKSELLQMIQSKNKFKHYEGFIKCCITFNPNIQYPLLAEKRNNKLMFTNCKKINVFTLPELRYLYELYQYDSDFSITPIEGFIFPESSDYFSTYISRLFDIKSQNQGPKRTLAKLLMNSLYGKFGQAYERDESIYQVFDSLDSALAFQDTLPQDSTKLKEKDGIYTIIKKEHSISVKSFMNVAIASYITAYARIELTKQLHYCESKNIPVYYCDSDSFVISNHYKHLIPISKSLGGWDIEVEMFKAQFLAPKCYIYQALNKESNQLEYFLKLKGIEKRKRNKILEITKDLSNPFTEIYNLIHQPIELEERFLKYKSAMRHGNILSSYKLTKTYSFKNDKRIFTNHQSIAYNDSNIHLTFLMQ